VIDVSAPGDQPFNVSALSELGFSARQNGAAAAGILTVFGD
jgi:hypothetical protein